jgi:hypothetical protein
LLEQLFSHGHRLPLNRKEAFYSATVLPGIIWSDGLAGFFRIIGKPNTPIDLNPDTTNVQAFSEYGLLDAIRGSRLISDAWKQLDLSGETPDFVILIDQATPLLVVIEAKLFDRSISSIGEQSNRVLSTAEVRIWPLYLG